MTRMVSVGATGSVKPALGAVSCDKVAGMPLLYVLYVDLSLDTGCLGRGRALEN